MPALSSPTRFPVTQWTSVVHVCQHGDAGAREKALADLCRDYWYPLYAFARRLGHSQHDAEDLTQGFFSQLLTHNILAGADRELGKLRTFLLAIFRRHIGDVEDRRQAVKRGGRQLFVPLDLVAAESLYGQEPADMTTPERLFERSWALRVLRAALTTLRGEEEAAGRARTMEVLAAFLDPEQTAAADTAHAAASLGLTPESVRQAVSRLRRRFRSALRRHIADTLRDPSDARIDEELAALQAALQ